MMWRMSYQDYRNWRKADFKEPHPPVEHEDHDTREGAERAKARAIEMGFTACVAPIPEPRVAWARKNIRLDEGQELFNKDWKLSP